MKTSFQQHIATNFTELYNSKVLLAVSGGIDSIVLMHLCQVNGIDYAVAHCNFHLRGEDSNLDQQFVESLTTRFKKKCFVANFDTIQYNNENKVSIQIAARELRYTWFEELMNEHNYAYLLTAHHLDDSMETFLINFSRGTGLEGLLGIPEKSNRILRPLLPFLREEIVEYAAANDIQWREDISNSQTKYLRNKIRKNVLPIFKEINPNIGGSFTEMMSFLKGSFALSKDAAEYKYAEVVTQLGDDLYFDIAKVKALSNPEAYLYQWLSPYGFTAWTDIMELLDADSGKKILSKEYILLKDRTSLILRNAVDICNNLESTFNINKNSSITSPIQLSIESVDIKGDEIDNCTVYLDVNELEFPLEIRKPREGDSFRPFGMQVGSKKLSKFFKDEKFSQFQKEDTWLLCSNDKIVWVIGHRIDNRYRISKNTINIIKLHFIK